MKAARLKSGVDYERVYREGQVRSGKLMRIHFAVSPTGQTRVGYVASRRVGTAVARNRARRVLREASRDLLKSVEAPHDIVFVAHRGLAETGSREARDATAQLLRRAGLAGDR